MEIKMFIKIYELLTYFIIYSFLGWVMESVVRTFIERKLINTGFLRGPYCPIYGIGAIIMFLFLEKFENKPIALFFIAIIVLTSWEYFVGFLLEKLFKTKYWDYSDQKFNIKGRICLKNSIYWGILGILFVKYIHPFIEGLMLNVDNVLKYYLTAIISLVMMVDFITSIIKVKNISATLSKIEDLNKEIKEKLKEITLLKEKLEKTAEESTIAENMQNMIEKLKERRRKIILRLYKNVYRLKKAFPAINTKEITEILNQKIEIKKKAKKT